MTLLEKLQKIDKTTKFNLNKDSYTLSEHELEWLEKDLFVVYHVIYNHDTGLYDFHEKEIMKEKDMLSRHAFLP